MCPGKNLKYVVEMCLKREKTRGETEGICPEKYFYFFLIQDPVLFNRVRWFEMWFVQFNPSIEPISLILNLVNLPIQVKPVSQF